MPSSRRSRSISPSRSSGELSRVSPSGDEPPVHRGRPGARPAMQEHDRRPLRVARFLPVHHMARIEPQLPGAVGLDRREQGAALRHRRPVYGGARRRGSAERAHQCEVGPEYGTVSYGLVREAAREALDSVFDTLIVCGFAFEPRVNEEALSRFPRLTVLKAAMNNDLHLADSLRSQTN